MCNYKHCTVNRWNVYLIFNYLLLSFYFYYIYSKFVRQSKQTHTDTHSPHFFPYKLFSLTCIPMDNYFDKLSQLFISSLMLLLRTFLLPPFFFLYSTPECMFMYICMDIYSLYALLENCTKLLPFLWYSLVHTSISFLCITTTNEYNKKTHI